MARKATGVDVGLRSGVFLEGRVQGNTFAVTNYAFDECTASKPGDAWEACDPGFAPKQAVVGVTGREVNIRYTRVPRLPDWQLRKLMRFEVEGVGGTEDDDVASDFNVLPELPELDGEDVVLLAMARESLLEQHADGLAQAGGSLAQFTPNAIGLYNAWLRFGVVLDDTVLLASIGHEHVDVVLVRGADLLFARNLAGGAGAFDQAIADRFGCDVAQAERLKRTHLDLTPNADFADQNAERASRACAAPAGQLLSLLQSTVMFAKSQVKLSSLKLDRIFICGGGAKIKGLDRYLSSATGVPVEPFDAFQVVDTSKLAPEAAAELEEHALESVVALGLATAGSDGDAYGIEILPKSVAKRREFAGGTLFLILAGLLGLGYLGWDYNRRSAALGDVKAEVAQLQRKERAATSSNAEAKEIAQLNEELSVEARELEYLLLSGEQVARTVEAVDATLPDNFWLTTVATSWGKDDDFGFDQGSEAPILRLEGRAQEGIEPNANIFQRFVAGLRAELPELRVRESMAPDGTRFSLRVTLVGSDAEPELDSQAEQEG